jgi:hypothetical protein
LKPEGSEPPAQAQWHFREVSRERAKKMTDSKKKLRADKLIPITAVDEKFGPAATGNDREPPSAPPPRKSNEPP